MTEETLFELARKTPEAERAALLDRACEGNPDLRARVEELLQADAGSSPLSKPSPTIDATAGYQATASYMSAEPVPGIVIAGRYTLEQKIGEGGMGEVWVAKQSEPVKRKVALKLIKPGMDSKSVVQRFEQERQALAMMDHPNIAKVLDGGITDYRQPFFVMELVNGLPLTKFCDETKLGIKERLELFVPICQAVQHAHQKGIVHRDLKPSNILATMIDGKPVPKVIDFGVAKATGGKLTDESMSTQFGTVIGTLEYMSPEQAGFSNQDVDTRADIYSLGVILYELFTGLRPFDSKRLKKAALDEVIRIIREEEPSKPSTKLSTDESLPSLAAVRHIEPGKLTALLRGELDWVVMKCLEKQRDRRYETANGLARDIQRYLAEEVVEARPPSAGYRLRKFIKRHKGQVVAALLVLLTLLAGIIGTSWGLLAAQRAQEREAIRADAEEKARKQAEEEKQKAVAFRNKALDALRATTGKDVEKLLGAKKELTANERAYLEAIAQRWQTFAIQEGTDEQSRAISAEGHFRVASLWQNLGRQEEARTAYEQAVILRQKLATDYPADPDYRRELAASHNNLGLLLQDLGKQSDAQVQYHKAILIQEKLAADFPEDFDYRRSLATHHNNLGILLGGLGKREEAEAHYRKGLVLQEKLTAEFTKDPDYRSDLARSHNNLGFLLAGMGRPDEAEEQYHKAIVIQENLAANFPADPGYQSSAAISHNNLGNLLSSLGKQAKAEEQYKKAIVIQEKLSADFPVVPDYRHVLASSHNNLGNVLIDLEKRAEAMEHLRKAQAIWEKLAVEFPAVPDYRVSLGGNYCNFGVVLLDGDKPAESLAWFDKAIKTLRPINEAEPQAVAAKQFLRISLMRRVRVLYVLDRHAEAVAETADMVRATDWDAGAWCNFACIYAMASTKIENKKTEYADRAIELLKKAVNAGHKLDDRIKNDSDLDPLREREDFKLLLSELEKKADKK